MALGGERAAAAMCEGGASQRLRPTEDVEPTFERSDALRVSATYLRAAFGGASAVYSLWLEQRCHSAVVVHLLLPNDCECSVQLSSDRLCFTPDNFAAPQLVRVDVVENRAHWNVITHRVFSLDRNYDRIVTPSVVVQTESLGAGTNAVCSLLVFGGISTKRKATALGPQALSRLDVVSALPVVLETRNDMLLGSPGTQSAGASWCVNHMASGCHFSVAVVEQSQATALLSWGLNPNGELGNGTLTSAVTPQTVVTLPMQLQGESLSIVRVSCGKHHVAVVTGQAQLFTWGQNKYGQLGLGDFSLRSQPQEVRFALAALSSHRRALRVKHTVQRGGNNVTHVACGAAHTLFITHQQQILGMGYNQAGQLGLGHRLQQHKGWRSCTPIAVEALRDQSILDLAAGQNHSACVLSNGDVYTWGCGDDGRLGNGKPGEGVATPTLVSLLQEVPVRARGVRCGARHMAVLSENDLLYIWGANDFGQLGCGDKKMRSRPYLLATRAFTVDGVADVALGEFHTTCVTFKGKAYVWGLDLQNGSAHIGARESPQLLHLPANEQVKKVSCGWTHTNIATCITSDEMESSRQETNFDRKMEKDRLLRRKEEVVRWKAYVATAVGYQREGGGDRVVRHAADFHPKSVKMATNNLKPQEISSTRLRRLRGGTSSLEQLVAVYVGQAVKSAQQKVAQLLCATGMKVSTTNRREPGKEHRHNSTSKNHSRELKGVFYRCQLRPPELPVVPASPARAPSHRKLLLSTPISSKEAKSQWPARRPASTSVCPRDLNAFQRAPSISMASRASLLEGLLRDRDGDRFAAVETVASDLQKSRPVRSPVHTTGSSSQRATPGPSPRRHLGVVEVLLHQPSYSIAESSLTPLRLRQPQ